MRIVKLLDIVVFSVAFVLALRYYDTSPALFDVIGIVTMIYVMVRNPDINTVTLISIILLVRVSDAFIFADYNQTNPYLFYAGIAAANVLMIGVVIARPVLIHRYGPKQWRENSKLTMTHQDAMVAWLYFAHAVLPTVTLIEHVIRHSEFVDLNPMFFYTLYKPAQFLLAVLGILVLYFMTFEKSKEARDKKKQRTLDA